MRTKSVEESTPPIGTAKEHAKNAEASEWKCRSAGNQECKTNDPMNYSDGAGDNHDCSDSQSPILDEKHSSTDCLNGSVIYADEGISVISNMSGLMPADSVDNLNTTDENDTKKSMASTNENHDSFKSEQESTPPVGTAKEHAKDAEDEEWECSLAKIKESMWNSGKSVAEDTPLLGTPKEHAKKEADGEWDESMRNSGKSVDENSPLIGTAKEHGKNAEASEWECSLTRNKEHITSNCVEEKKCSKTSKISC